MLLVEKRIAAAATFVLILTAGLTGSVGVASNPARQRGELAKPARESSSTWQMISSSHWVGLNDVAVMGPYLYCTMERGIQVLYRDRSGGIQTGERIPTESPATLARVFGGSLFIVEGMNRVVEYDLAHPELPLLKRAIQLESASRTASQLLEGDSLLFLLTSDSGVHIIDWRFPGGPQLVGRYWPGVRVTDMDLQDSMLYISTDSNRIDVVNVANPSQPERLARLISSYSPGALDVSGQRLFVHEQAGFLLSSVAVYDVLNGSDLRLLNRTFRLNYAGDIQLLDSLLVLTNFDDVLEGGMSIHRISDAGELSYLAGHWFSDWIGHMVPLDDGVLVTYGTMEPFGSGFRIHELPTARTTSHFGPLNQVASVLGQGGHAYLVRRSSGPVVIDLSDPGHPAEASSIEYSFSYTYTLSVVVQGSTLMVSTSRGLRLFDVSVPEHPIALGDEPVTDWNWKAGLALNGSLAYVSHREGMKIVDISVPANPAIVGITTIQSSSMELLDGVLWVIDQSGTIRALDVTIPDRPVEITQFMVTGARELATAPGLVVCSDQRRAHVFDVSDVSSPMEVSTIEVGHDIEGIDVQQRMLAVACGRDGVRRYDLTHPSSPALVDTLDTPGFAESVNWHNDLLLVADRSSLLLLGSELSVVSGDATGDGTVSIADAVYLAHYLFADGPPPQPTRASGDADCDGRVSILDVISVVNFVMRGGKAPACEGFSAP